MTVKHSKWIVPAALTLALPSAWAGQITLYERPDFRGPSVVANERIETVSRQGLGDTASSIVVTDGRWEVCTQEYFRGRCTELLPGNYPSLSVSLNGRVGSARQIGYADPSPMTSIPAPRVVVVEPQIYSRSTVVTPVPASGRAYLYEDPNFSGAWVAMDRGEANDLDWAHFSNPSHRATSLRVESGTWLFCTDMAFQGDCRVLGPGEYRDLSGVLAPGIASARQVYAPEYGTANPVPPYRRW